MLEALISAKGEIIVVKKKPAIWSERERREFKIIDLTDNATELKVGHVLCYPYAVIEGGSCNKCGQCCRMVDKDGTRLCVLKNGYFDDEKLADAMKEKHGWSKESGFLGETGCVIPEEERSKVCLGFLCEWARCPQMVAICKYVIDPLSTATSADVAALPVATLAPTVKV